MRLFDVERDSGLLTVFRDERLVDRGIQLTRRVVGDVEDLVGTGVVDVFDHNHHCGGDDGDDTEDVQQADVNQGTETLEHRTRIYHPGVPLSSDFPDYSIYSVRHPTSLDDVNDQVTWRQP